MRLIPRLAIPWVLATVTASWGQLYLITGSPTPKYNERYGVTLLRVGEDGAIRASEIVSAKTGTEWIATSQDGGKALILPAWPDDTVSVVDFGKAAVAKQCSMPSTLDVSLIEQWLMDLPGRGLSYVEFLAGDAQGNQTLRGMSMDTSLPCEKSFFPVTPDQLPYIVADGRAGVADMGSRDGIGVRIDPAGQVKRRIPGFDVAFDLIVPQELRMDITNPSAGIVCNNSQLLALSTYRGTGEKLLVLRKRDQTWHVVPIPSEKLTWLRAFGKYLVISEAWTGGPLHKESAGRAAWRKKPGSHGPGTEDRLRESNAVFPGRLHLFNIDSEKMLTIETKQADSEVLLIDRNSVYYRADTRLFSAEITDGGITHARLVAEGEAIRDAHWAFFRPQ
jgi:hypothetical protein